MTAYNGAATDNVDSALSAQGPCTRGYRGVVDSRESRITADAVVIGYDEGYDEGFADGAGSVTFDTTSPIITIISPPPGSTIGPSSELVFRITDETGLARVMPAIKFTRADNTFHYEIIHDGDNFTRDYSGTRTVITGGFEFNIRRVNNWTGVIEHAGGNPELVPFSFDTSGNEPD